MSMTKYKSIKLLGKGGFGSATLVSLKSDPRKLYVLKEVKVGHERKAQEDAAREAKFLQGLHHPNIVGFVETWMDAGKLYIVMEYADGGDLSQRVTAIKSSRGFMSEDEALNLFVQICLALKHMHDRRILHRDLKCQNVFLTKGGIVKVCRRAARR